MHPEEDFLLILMSDHGRGVDRLEFSFDHFIEHRLPLTIFLGNKDLIARIDKENTLNTNTQRLVGRYDLHLTLKTLGLVPYGKIDLD